MFRYYRIFYYPHLKDILMITLCVPIVYCQLWMFRKRNYFFSSFGTYFQNMNFSINENCAIFFENTFCWNSLLNRKSFMTFPKYFIDWWALQHSKQALSPLTSWKEGMLKCHTENDISLIQSRIQLLTVSYKYGRIFLFKTIRL